MSAIKLITDGYDRKARLYPALVCLAPVVLTAMAVLGIKESAIKSVAATIVGCGGAFLLSQLARDEGKKKEPGLYELWGGMPSVAILRHRDKRLDSITKERYHKKLASLVKTKVPTPAEEEQDPRRADETYAAWSSYARVHTRDTKKYGLVFQELVQYGYRPNIWGLRPAGITLSSITVLVALMVCVLRYRSVGSGTIEAAGAGALSIVFLLLWIFRFTPDWVRIPADAYAQRLAESVDEMAAKKPAEKPAMLADKPAEKVVKKPAQKAAKKSATS